MPSLSQHPCALFCWCRTHVQRSFTVLQYFSQDTVQTLQCIHWSGAWAVASTLPQGACCILLHWCPAVDLPLHGCQPHEGARQATQSPENEAAHYPLAGHLLTPLGATGQVPGASACPAWTAHRVHRCLCKNIARPTDASVPCGAPVGFAAQPYMPTPLAEPANKPAHCRPCFKCFFFVLLMLANTAQAQPEDSRWVSLSAVAQRLPPLRHFLRAPPVQGHASSVCMHGHG